MISWSGGLEYTDDSLWMSLHAYEHVLGPQISYSHDPKWRELETRKCIVLPFFCELKEIFVFGRTARWETYRN